MPLNISMSFNDEFVNLYNYLHNSTKYKKCLELEGVDRKSLDIAYMSKKYFKNNVADVSIDANANVQSGKNPNNYNSEVVNGIHKLEGYYLIWKNLKNDYGLEKANELFKKIIEGAVYFHDSTNVQVPYCVGTTTSNIMIEGRPYNELISVAPKRAESFIGQIVEFVMDMSQEFAGAIALSDFFINYAWYAKDENLDKKTIENHFQKMVHILNNKFRTSAQSPFSNLSLFDKPGLEILFGEHLYPDGTTPDFDYILKIQKIFADWFSLGDPSTNMPYRFPVVTANITQKNGEIIDKDFFDYISEVNLKTGFLNIYITDGTNPKLSSCCRLLSDINETIENLKGVDSFGNGGVNLGSHRVVTVNLARIGYLANNQSSEDKKSRFLHLLNEELYDIKLILLSHRKLIEHRIEQGFLKFFKPLQWLDLKGHFFSTIGVNGFFEAFENMEIDIASEEGLNFASEIMNYIDKKRKNFSKQTGYMFNVEQVPAESAAIKLAKKDELLGYNKNYNLYSNQFIPLIKDIDLHDRIKIDGLFSKALSGGGITHINLGEKLEKKSQMQKMIKFAIAAGVEHFAINYVFSLCSDCKENFIGKINKCLKCESENIEHLTRIIGYFVPIKNWTKIRREEEFDERKWYTNGSIDIKQSK